jgi:ATP-dependent exoDNAse (exonuclease V) beta subunit
MVDLEADSDAVREVAELQGRLLGATPEEVEAAVDSVNRALEHPLLKRAARAASEGRCRRETHVLLRLANGTVIEGIVDLAFKEDSEEDWTVVDFKTDGEIRGSIGKYEAQVGFYAEAIARATGCNAQGVLLRV